MASRIIEAKYRIALVESTGIDDPVTVGVFHPAILLPSKVLPDLGEQELLAVLAHEYGHIRRRDFPVHILCELIKDDPLSDRIQIGAGGPALAERRNWGSISESAGTHFDTRIQVSFGLLEPM